MVDLDASSMAASLAQDLHPVASCAYKKNILAYACRCGDRHAKSFAAKARDIAFAGAHARWARCFGALRPAGRAGTNDAGPQGYGSRIKAAHFACFQYAGAGGDECGRAL